MLGMLCLGGSSACTKYSVFASQQNSNVRSRNTLLLQMWKSRAKANRYVGQPRKCLRFESTVGCSDSLCQAVSLSDTKVGWGHMYSWTEDERTVGGL